MQCAIWAWVCLQSYYGTGTCETEGACGDGNLKDFLTFLMQLCCCFSSLVASNALQAPKCHAASHAPQASAACFSITMRSPCPKRLARELFSTDTASHHHGVDGWRKRAVAPGGRGQDTTRQDSQDTSEI